MKIQGANQRVHAERLQEARSLDADQNGLIDDQEILAHLQLDGLDLTRGDARALMDEFKLHLQKRPHPELSSYPSSDQVAEELGQLEHRYPELARRVSLGQTHEGREIWALQISRGVRCEDTSSRPGVVLTGLHHAREWMSSQPPLEVARQLLEGYASDPEMKRRVDRAEIWVVPVVNPDGYEYSRSQDNWWKKNRRPVGETACSEPTEAIGTDLNRNYLSPRPQDLELYRPSGDTPCSTTDDFEHTSDDPGSPHYRGPQGSSEPEVQALLRLELGRGNIRGVLDHHGYGEMILYPWSHTQEPPPDRERLHDLGQRMNQALGSDFRVMQSSELYTNSGSSDGVHYANGILSYTLEIGRSYQPPSDQIAPISQSVARANLLFIDEVLEPEQQEPTLAIGDSRP